MITFPLLTSLTLLTLLTYFHAAIFVPDRIFTQFERKFIVVKEYL
jgi:hypothetical protein